MAKRKFGKSSKSRSAGQKYKAGGGKKKKRKKIVTDDMILFTGKSRRYVHWFTFITFFLALLTGIFIMYKVSIGYSVEIGGKPTTAYSLLPPDVGGTKTLLNMHVVFGVLFFLGIIIMVLQWLPWSLRWRKTDSNWWGKFGGYFRKWSPVPPAGRLNGGQKVWTILFFLVSALAFLTGAAMFIKQIPAAADSVSADLHRISLSLHAACYAFMVLLVLVHIYFSAVATNGNWNVMWGGVVKLTWAERFHSEWCKTSPLFAQRLEAMKRAERTLEHRKKLIAAGVADSGEEKAEERPAPASVAVAEDDDGLIDEEFTEDELLEGDDLLEDEDLLGEGGEFDVQEPAGEHADEYDLMEDEEPAEEDAQD